MERLELDKILYNKKLSPETKVYRIARLLHENDELHTDLWYALLDMKDKYIEIIMKEKDD